MSTQSKEELKKRLLELQDHCQSLEDDLLESRNHVQSLKEQCTLQKCDLTEAHGTIEILKRSLEEVSSANLHLHSTSQAEVTAALEEKVRHLESSLDFVTHQLRSEREEWERGQAKTQELANTLQCLTDMNRSLQEENARLRHAMQPTPGHVHTSLSLEKREKELTAAYRDEMKKLKECHREEKSAFEAAASLRIQQLEQTLSRYADALRATHRGEEASVGLSTRDPPPLCQASSSESTLLRERADLAQICLVLGNEKEALWEQVRDAHEAIRAMVRLCCESVAAPGAAMEAGHQTWPGLAAWLHDSSHEILSTVKEVVHRERNLLDVHKVVANAI